MGWSANECSICKRNPTRTNSVLYISRLLPLLPNFGFTTFHFSLCRWRGAEVQKKLPMRVLPRHRRKIRGQAPKFAPVGGNLLTCSCIVERARKARKGFEVTYSIEYIHRPTQLWHFPHFSNAPMVADVDPSEYDRPERVRPRRRSHPARPRQGMY